MTTITEPKPITTTPLLVLGETIITDNDGNKYVLIRRVGGALAAVDVPDEPEGPTLYHGKPAYVQAHDGSVFVLDAPTWTRVLWLANAHGWEPEAPTCFDFGGGRALYAGDAKKCAKALTKALDLWDRDPPAQNKGPYDVDHPLHEVTSRALFHSDDQPPLQVNVWAEVRSGMKNLAGAYDTGEWRRIAAFIKNSGGLSIHAGKDGRNG